MVRRATPMRAVAWNAATVNPRTAIGPFVLAALGLSALVCALVWTIRYDGNFTDPAGLSWRYAACWALFAVALLALRRVPARLAVPLVLAGAFAVAATGLVAA